MEYNLLQTVSMLILANLLRSMQKSLTPRGHIVILQPFGCMLFFSPQFEADIVEAAIQLLKKKCNN